MVCLSISVEDESRITKGRLARFFNVDLIGTLPAVN